MSPSPRTYVQEPLLEARLIGDYCRYSGCLKDGGTLFEAIGAVELLQNPSPSDPAVVALQKSLHDISPVVSFWTQAKLRRTRNALRVKKAETRQTMWLVFASILLMIITGSLTIVHNKGVVIVRELEDLASIPAGRTYVQMLWEVTQARNDLDAVQARTNLSQESELAVQGYLDDVYDLRALSERLTSAQAKTSEFLSNDVHFPLPGQRMVYCSILRTSQGTGFAPPNAALKLGRFCETESSIAFISATRPQSRQACEAGLLAQGGQGKQLDATGQAASTSTATIDVAVTENFVDEMDLTARRLSCAGTMVFSVEHIRNFRDQIELVRQTVAGYGLWLLPAFYGAMGAIIFHLRRMLDPHHSNPPLPRLFHRVVLGALAGVVLSWFFTPHSQFGSGFADVGFTLFGLAFLFGFSLDVFFAVLDKLVSVSVAAVDRFGSSRQDGTH